MLALQILFIYQIWFLNINMLFVVTINLLSIFDWHNRIPFVNFLHLTRWEPNIFSHLSWKVRCSQTFFLLWTILTLNNYWYSSFSNSSSINLTKFRFVCTTLWINIMSKQILSVNSTPNWWLGVSISIRMKGRFSKISSKSWVRKPSWCRLNLIYSGFKFLFLSFSHWLWWNRPFFLYDFLVIV